MPDTSRPVGTSARPTYDEFVIGQPIPFGRMHVTEDEITAFARAFDPQPFHLSEETARDTNIGRLIASGYHTCALIMRMMVDDLLDSELAQGAPGVKEVRFLKPVFPGDTLSARCTCTAKRPLKSRPEMGILSLKIELLNQREEQVMEWSTSLFMRMGPRRSAA